MLEPDILDSESTATADADVFGDTIQRLCIPMGDDLSVFHSLRATFAQFLLHGFYSLLPGHASFFTLAWLNLQLSEHFF